jgi:hypothetical protein
MGRAEKLKAERQAEIKLDFGCGKKPREGFAGVDIRDFGQKYVVDLTKRWPWKDESVSEAHTSHFIEHLTGPERIHFVNELWRVLVPGGKCQVVTPHWNSCRAYGDLTHQWPPVSEFWFYYLSAPWRTANAPHNDAYTCHFEATWGYALRGDIVSRNVEFQQFALANYKEVAQDLIATLVKVAHP